MRYWKPVLFGTTCGVLLCYAIIRSAFTLAPLLINQMEIVKVINAQNVRIVALEKVCAASVEKPKS